MNEHISVESQIGTGTYVGLFTQIRENVKIGSNCRIGKNVYIDHDVIIGDNVKIQNNVNIYFPAIIESGVFIGPNVSFTNDIYPRAIDQKGNPLSKTDWEPQQIHIKYGASVGASAVLISPLTIGRWSMIAAGSIVTKNVNDFSLTMGNPAKHKKWIDEKGQILVQLNENKFFNRTSNKTMIELDGVLIENI